MESTVKKIKADASTDVEGQQNHCNPTAQMAMKTLE
jgi:hypothetical protein